MIRKKINVNILKTGFNSILEDTSSKSLRNIRLKTGMFFLLTLFLKSGVFTQEIGSETHSIYMISRAYIDSVMLRWAPGNYESWLLGNKNGYIIERYTILKDNKPYPDRRPIRLNKNPITPVSVDEWERMAESDNYAGVAAQAIYGESFEPEASDESPAISIFNKASEQQNRYSFALFAADYSARVAKGLGLMLTDRNVIKGEKYLYVVYFANTDNFDIDTAYTFIGPDEIMPLKKPTITQTVAENKLVTLEWMAPKKRAGYTSFEVQRSDNGGSSFSNRNSSPLINTFIEGKNSDNNFFIDTLPENNKKFIYRVRGTNPFGEKGPWSDTVAIEGKEKVNEMPKIVNHQALENTVLLEWEFSKKSEKNIKGFQVVRSTSSNRGFESVSGILDVKERTFYDSNPISTAYYKVYAFDKNMGLTSSFAVLVQAIDSIPPAAPSDLQATVDTTGKVFLSWKANPDDDIYGYRIYKANAKHEEFSQITVRPVADSFYLDQVQLKTLSRNVYYRVMAIDKRQNYSEFSEILEVTRPDIIPPVAPVIKNIYSTERGVCLEWIPSSSTDIYSQIILRKKTDTDKWQEIYKITDTSTSFCDTLAERGIIYDFTLAAYDKSGLKSVSEQKVSGKKQNTSMGIELSCKVRKSSSSIELNWEPKQVGVKYILYRAKDNGPLKTYTAISPDSETFTDMKVTPEATYHYMLKCISKGKIALSNEVVVKY